MKQKENIDYVRYFSMTLLWITWKQRIKWSIQVNNQYRPDYFNSLQSNKNREKGGLWIVRKLFSREHNRRRTITFLSMVFLYPTSDLLFLKISCSISTDVVSMSLSNLNEVNKKGTQFYCMLCRSLTLSSLLTPPNKVLQPRESFPIE